MNIQHPSATCDRPRQRISRFIYASLMALVLLEPVSAHADAPGLVHEGKWVRVPEGSPYRSRIAVEPTRLDNVNHEVTVPGIIEADPAQSVNILPPLAGRLVELSAHVGQSVVAGQVLARIRSGGSAVGEPPPQCMCATGSFRPIASAIRSASAITRSA